MLLAAVLLLGSASTLRAASVTASWDKNPESDIARYQLSYGTQSGVYTTSLNVGNVTSYPLTLTDGQRYFFVVQAVNTAGLMSPYSAEVVYSSTPITTPAVVLDSPAPNSTVGHTMTIAGWAVDRGALGGTGVDAVYVWAYPSSGAAAQFVGVATYGHARPDIGALFGSQFTNSGYQLTVAVNPGSYTFVAFAYSVVANAFDGVAVSANVTVQAVSTQPHVFIDTPGTNTTVTRPFTLSGWAVDAGAATGTGIDGIAVWAYPTSGAAPVFVGYGGYGDPRPDIAALFGDIRFTNSAYALSVTASTLAAGAYDLVVFGHSTVTGAFTAAGVVRVTAQ